MFKKNKMYSMKDALNELGQSHYDYNSIFYFTTYVVNNTTKRFIMSDPDDHLILNNLEEKLNDQILYLYKSTTYHKYHVFFYIKYNKSIGMFSEIE